MTTSNDILEELQTCKKPLFFLDDDADGLCAFLLLYRYVKEGSSIIVKSNPLDGKLLRKVEEYQPDKVFVLDIPLVADEFFDNINVPKIWIDHHPPVKKSGVIYLNPRIENPEATIPTSKLCYDIVGQDLWISMVGITADWVFIPEMVEKFRKEYLDLLPESITTPEAALFETKLGELAKIFNFLVTGTTKDIKKSVNVLTRIKDPYEILNQTSDQGKYLYKKYKSLSQPYDDLLNAALAKKTEDKFLVFTYDPEVSFTSLLSNELLYKCKDKIIIVAREKGGYFRGSLRSPKGINIREVLEKSIVDMDARGGGHDNACGFAVNVSSWNDFLTNLKLNLPIKKE